MKTPARKQQVGLAVFAIASLGLVLGMGLDGYLRWLGLMAVWFGVLTLLLWRFAK